MRRKRKIAPYFPTHPPFNPITGQYASLTGEQGVSPYCVLMQVAADDIYADYVICRGFDTRILAFVDYEAGNPDKPGIPVAKPYGNRKTGVYKIGEVYPALLPTQGNATYMPPSPSEINLRLGQNPGVVVGTPEVGGQPSNLNAVLAPLFDHNGVAVNWMFIDGFSKQSVDELSPCDEIQPGSYRATAGETIAPGAIGTIVIEVSGGDDVLISAKNQSNCTFYVGNLLTAFVEKNCEVYFTGCSCCDASSDPNDPLVPCCDRYIYVCFDGIPFLWQLFESGVFRWGSGTTDIDPTEKCDICLSKPWSFGITNWVFTLSITCVDGVITATWKYWCHVFPWTPISNGSGYLIAEGTFDWSGLCSDPPTEYASTFTVEGCEFTIYASRSPINCDKFIADPPTCCDESRWVCINNDSRLMAFDGGDETWTVTDCCPGCTSATVRLRMSCSNGVVTLQRTYTCDGVSSTEATNISSLCTNSAPMVINIPTAQCFLSAIISQTEQACGVCETCCDETRWFCINNVSKQMNLVGDSDTFDISACCDCETSILTLSVECIGQTNTLRFDWSITCTGLEPVTGFDFLPCDASVLNITVNDCFYQVQISATNIGCDACSGGPSPTTPPPL